MHTCTVARKRSGSSRSFLTASARLSLRRINSRKRVLRTLRIAISAPAKSPLPTKKASTIRIDVLMRAGAHLTLYAAVDVDAGSSAGARAQELHHARWSEE